MLKRSGRARIQINEICATFLRHLFGRMRVANSPLDTVKKRALTIESDPQVADLLVSALKGALGSPVDHAADGQTAVSMAESFDYSLIALELTAPTLGGAELCAALRSAQPLCPLLAVTARADAIPFLLGTRSGVDDYVLKPIVPRELAAKALALWAGQPTLARPAAASAPPDFAVGGISFRSAERSLVVENKESGALSVAEFDLVCFLARNAGVWFSEEQILAALWGLNPPVSLRYLGIDFRRLRMKLRGVVTGFRYLAVAGDGRMRLDMESSGW